jgi:site-specific DNA recombinase
MAQEQLQKNAHHSPRRTIEPALLQGMLVCQRCGYALYRTSTRTSKQKLDYCRCLGSDGYRRLKGPVCTNRPVRQDSPDQIVWDEIIRLLDDPSLIQSEIDRRRQAAFETNPSRKREEELRREQARLEKNIERIISAYQEALVTLPQLRQRMPELHRQIHAVEAELHSLEIAAVDDARYLQLAETLATFRGKLRARAETLDVGQRQQILRLPVKEILVGNDTITIRHSLPIRAVRLRTCRNDAAGFRYDWDVIRDRLSFAFGESLPLLAACQLSSPTICRLPILPPSATS